MIGRTLKNRYQILEMLAQDARGTTYKARDAALNRDVMLKVLPKLSDSARQRFFKQAKAAAQLHHPNIAAVYDFGTDEYGAPFVVLEYVEGKPLSDLVPAPPEVVVDLGQQIADALEYAHQQGIVHADLTPANIRVTPSGQAIILDMGLRLAETASTVTATGALTGNPAYLSPEQVQGLQIDRRTDIYALGVALYELATGQPPFQGSTPMEVVIKQVTESPAPPRALVPDLPPQLEEAILTALQKDPAGRDSFLGKLDLALLDIDDKKDSVPFQAESAPAGEMPPPAPPPPPAAPAPPKTVRTAPPPGAGAPDSGEAKPQQQPIWFSAHYPKEVKPDDWQPLHAYVFKQSAENAVSEDAQKQLGSRALAFRKIVQAARQAILEGELITATPTLPGFWFNPPSVSVAFFEDWHRFDFKLRAHAAPLNQSANGLLTFTVAGVIVADIPLSIFVGETVSDSEQTSASSKPYQAIFCSYSHADTHIVERVERAYKALGLDYLRDVVSLKSGTHWSAELLQLIENADIFQLFWSEAAAQSEYVKQEWQHALKLNRDQAHFIRPVYWRQPLPPVPPEMRHIHFAYQPDLGV